jgi:hypothetical protein
MGLNGWEGTKVSVRSVPERTAQGRQALEGAPPLAAFAKGGDFDFAARMLRFIPRATRGKSNVKSPTLTSNGTSLGWGTLEILPGIRDSAHPTAFGWGTRPS